MKSYKAFSFSALSDSFKVIQNYSNMFLSCLFYHFTASVSASISKKLDLIISILSGLLFLTLHSHVEAVAWISARSDLVSTFFCLAASHEYRVNLLNPETNFMNLSTSLEKNLETDLYDIQNLDPTLRSYTIKIKNIIRPHLIFYYSDKKINE